MKQVRLLSLTIIAMMVTTSCALFKTTPPPTSYYPNFDFSPPTTSKSALSSNVKIILLHPVYAAGFINSNDQLFTTFSSSMAKDFEEMINARGYALKGPFNTYDELIFKDKNEMDMCLVPQIEIHFNWDQGALKSAPNYLTKGTDYWIEGNCTITGKVNLQATETLSGQKVWSPSIPIPNQSVYIKTFHKYTGSNIPFNDPNYHNSISKALESIYADVMKIAWNKLDPDELNIVKADCDQIKKKKTF